MSSQKNFLQPPALLLATIFFASIISGCQFIQPGGSGQSQQAATNPCLVLALPASGPYAATAAKIKRGAGYAREELLKRGIQLRLENINTEAPDWLAKLEALPEMCTVVGGPLQDKKYVEARKSGILQKRVFFSFLPTLQKNDEGALAWRFFPSPKDQIDALVRFATDTMNIRTYGAFYPADNYGTKMTELLAANLSKRNIPLERASYNPGAPASWSDAIKPLIRPTASGVSSSPIPQTAFEAIFLPDSWKNMDMLTTSMLNNGEDRLVMLGTTLWEHVGNRPVNKPSRYLLAVFPGAWDSTKAPARLKSSGNDFWSALGFDFVNFGVSLALASRPTTDQVTARAQKASSSIKAIAPINWSANGIGSEQLYIFQVTAGGMKPVKLEEFRQLRNSVAERSALRMQGLDENGNSPETSQDIPQQDPAQTSSLESVSAEPVPGAAPTPTAAPARRPAEMGIIGTTPQPSYKLRLPVKR